MDDTFLESGSGNSILSFSPTKALPNAFSSLLLALLEQEQAQSRERAASIVADQKKEAEKSREQIDRTTYATNALFHAIASGSLALYNDTLIWARRFVRDPLTAKILFAKYVNNTEEGIRLLSGIPPTLERSHQLKPVDISTRVSEANRIILAIFETACLALKEPSFHQPHWTGTLQLLGDVVKKRLDLSDILQHRLNLTDDQFYEVLWSDTVKLALHIENVGLKPGYEPLALRNPTGLFLLNHLNVGLDKISLSSLRFIDNLARGRDALWREFRASLHPAVAKLPSTLPRGLPIQCLTPFINIAVESAYGLTPFISSKAEAIVFPNSRDALILISEDKDIRSAIGSFVDNFCFALQIYVLQGPTSNVRKERLMRAWFYALESLSQGRMAPEEARRTWKMYFRRALPDFDLAGPDPEQSMEYPILPFKTNSNNSVEWNPADAFHPPPAVKARPLQPPTYLDCSLNTSSSRVQLQDTFIEPHIQTIGFEPCRFDVWSINRIPKKQISTPSVREGLIFSALLFLESCLANPGSILVLPFPSKSEIRYPNLRLTSDFMRLDGLGYKQAMDLLESLLVTVPASLLFRLTDAALGAMSSSDLSEGELTRLEHLAYGLLSLLTKSDRPYLATDFVLKVIIEQPNSSSWHRKLLSRGFLKRLSASQARNQLKSFAGAIQERMKEQASTSKQPAVSLADEVKPPSKPYIKVTTIKYLAQLLNGGDFVSGRFAIGILSELFQSSTHLDVRTEIVASMLGMLMDCNTEQLQPLGQQIISALEFTISIAGGMDERRQLREEDWIEAERTGELPEVYAQGNSDLDKCIPPILAAILAATVTSRNMNEILQGLLMRRVLLPILELSIATNTRWLQLFAAKYGLEIHSLDLPILPVKPKFLKQIVSYNRHNPPASLLHLYHRFILTNISPPPGVALLNKKLQDPALRNLPDTKHWLSLYGHGPGIYSYDGFQLSRMLRNKIDSPSTSSISVTQVQDYVFEQANKLLLYAAPATFNHFMQAFEPPRLVKDADPVDWLHDARAAVKRIITLIDALRTPEWQQNHHRQPSVLPETLQYRLWLLPYPELDSNARKLRIFADALQKFVKEISAVGHVYHEQLPEVQTAALRVMPCHRARIACQLGTLKEEMVLVDLLCVEIAQALFETAGPPQDETVIVASKGVSATWRASAIEWIRKKGDRLLRKDVFQDKIWSGLLLGEEAK